MKNVAAVSILLLASTLDVAPRCGGCGASDRDRELAREVDRPAPAPAIVEPAPEAPATPGAAAAQRSPDDDHEPAAPAS
ncbi:MAG: hypothetical protein H6713_03350 [Myxococcales bacterium]|nr:hypothetical protein [Myxococcales bacterium]MCB9749025.1 hypothetical protein [Myxococcales bacterium]